MGNYERVSGILFGLIALATGTYLGLCAAIAALAKIPFRQAVANFGYAFLPVEFGTAILAFGDDALEFFGIVQPAASILLGLGFIWSLVLMISIVRHQCNTKVRRVAVGIPLGVVLLGILFLWLSWYTSGAVVDVT